MQRCSGSVRVVGGLEAEGGIGLSSGPVAERFLLGGVWGGSHWTREAPMKSNIHPKYYPNCKVYHNGQVVMEVGATVPELHVEVWSGSHPFFTGKNVFVDSAGRVEKFQRKFQGNYFQKKDAKPAAETKA